MRTKRSATEGAAEGAAVFRAPKDRMPSMKVSQRRAGRGTGTGKIRRAGREPGDGEVRRIGQKLEVGEIRRVCRELEVGDIRRVGRDAVYGGHLVLVNREHPVRDFHDPVLRDVTAVGLHALDAVIALETACLSRLKSLIAAAGATDDIVVVSGYRSMEEQTAIYEGSLMENGPVYTANYVALPGRSEHQTGLAVDVGERIEGELDFIAPSFPDHGRCLAFKRLATKFGFIQRYKEGKEALTGIACEPWHFRYVGTPHAVCMEKLNLCLEEYIAYVRQFSYEEERLAYEGEGWRAEIYFVAAEGEGDAETAVRVPACDAYTLSGNNVDGFIVTAYYGGGYDG